MRHYHYKIADGKRIAWIDTPHGIIQLPAFLPVTTFGEKYPLDKMVQPYLPRLSQCLMVSHHYAQEMKKRLDMPLFIDSGGFAGLFEGSEIVVQEDHACIKTREGNEIDPLRVLSFQERNADIGATLDFIIPPACERTEAERRQQLTIKNALYAQMHSSSSELMLYASLQCWDEDSARSSARLYAQAEFEGIAIGGMVPRAKDVPYMERIVRAVRDEAPNCAIHIFGCGSLETIPTLIAAGADSFDSSSYVRGAVETRHLTGTSSAGIHTALYTAIRRLWETNSAVKGIRAHAVEDDIPNMKLCLLNKP